MSTSTLPVSPSADHRAELERPLGQAEGLPGACYGEDYYRREQRTVFVNRWAAVAVGAQLPQVGDALPVDLAGWQLLLVRREDGEIAAFHNVCRHRAMKLVTEPCSGSKSLRCPWHSWRYALDGTLLATPEVGGDRIGEADGFDRSQLGLKPVRVGRWLDYVFVNIDGQAPPFDQHIAPLADLLGNVVLDDLHHLGSFEHRYAGNWKIVTESGIEDYHLPFGHPQLNARLLRNSTPRIAEPVYCGVATDLGALPPGEETRAWNALLADLPRRDPGLPTELYAMNVFPTGGMLLAADHLMLGIHLPDGPSSTRVQVNVYGHGESATSPELAEARAAVFAMWHEVLGQDALFIEGVQATLATRDAADIRTRFSPYWEAAVHSFQRMVADAVD